LAAERVDIEMVLVGKLVPENLTNEMKLRPAWSRVQHHGWKSRQEMNSLLSRASVGLVVFHPERNHIEAQPNKIFEYMAASIPVIASDFPRWRTIVGDTGAGIMVDPKNPQEISDALIWMAANQNSAREMGKRGRDAVLKEYNWESQASRLLSLYERLVGK
jgi:glycosyltransferase involved in cell wall biosynthesis